MAMNVNLGLMIAPPRLLNDRFKSSQVEYVVLAHL